MGWFRAHCSVIVWLAFFALACHFTLSFGHLHIPDFKSGVAAAVPAAHAAQAVQATDDDAPLSQKDPSGFADDFCAVCANLILAGALILPVLALILAPSLFIKVFPWSVASREPDAFDHCSFSARGPPLV